MTRFGRIFAALSVFAGPIVGCGGLSPLSPLSQRAGEVHAAADPVDKMPAAKIPVAENQSRLNECDIVRLAPNRLSIACESGTTFHLKTFDRAPTLESMDWLLAPDREQLLNATPTGPKPQTKTWRTVEGTTPDGLYKLVVAKASGGSIFQGICHGIAASRPVCHRRIAEFAERGLPQMGVLDTRAAEVNFAGRALRFDGKCETHEARNAACYRAGQIDWGEFESVADAETALAIRREISAKRLNGRLLDEAVVACQVDGVPAECHRARHWVRIPPEVKARRYPTSDTLVIYRVIAEVRSRTLLTVCSFFTDQASEDGLAPLCRQVIELTPERPSQ
ncbi:MAG: hypothetical protein ACI9U2_004322 [Bradymonadia bacterium]|jgi:hypothetical protein